MKKQIIIISLPLLVAGCAGTNPKPAFNDVKKTVNARLGQTVEWHNTNEVVQTVASLLRTNLTPQSAVTIALLNNKSLQAQFGEIGISQAELAQASRLHNITIAGSWRIPDRPPSALDAEYSASADFLDLLTLPARKKVAARNLEQTKLEVADKVLHLAIEAQTAIYELQAQMELVKRLATIIEVNDAQVDVAQRQYDAGNISDAELRNQQAMGNQSHLDLMRAKAQVKADRERLNRLLGLSGEQINWQIADELPSLPEKEAPVENLESLAVHQRLDLAAERKRAESIAAALQLKKNTRFIPGVSIGVDTERTPDGQRVTGPTLDLELPLFDQGQPAIAKLAAQFQQARDNYMAQELNVRSEVREALDAMLAAREAAEFSQKNLLPLRKQILRDTQLQYNAMQKGNFELLSAKEREQNSEQTNVEALRDYWLARVALERAVGGRLDLSPSPMPQKSQAEPQEHEHHHE
jgi:cobalt-zinc-cadmium efflux system outer membrane protein